MNTFVESQLEEISRLDALLGLLRVNANSRAGEIGGSGWVFDLIRQLETSRTYHAMMAQAVKR